MQRVVITQNTLAIKVRLKPIVFIHKRDCIAFGPIRGIFTLSDGSEYALADLNIPGSDGAALKAFVLDHWWSELGREQIEAALEQELPMPRHRIRLLFATIVVCFAVGFCALLLSQTGAGLSVFLGLIGGVLLMLFLVKGIPEEITARENERLAYRYPLPPNPDIDYASTLSNDLPVLE